MDTSSNKYRIHRVIGKTWRLMLFHCPKEVFIISIFTIGGSVFVGLNTYLWKVFFESIYDISINYEITNKLIISFALLVSSHILQKVFDIFSGLYHPRFLESIKFALLGEIHEKINEIPMEYYENPSLYDVIHRANGVVSSGSFQRFFSYHFTSISMILNVISVTVVLAGFSPWLILLCIISVIPPFIARIVRGANYYYMQTYHTPKIRIQGYLWSLLVSRESVKEIKVFGFGDYLKKKWADYKKTLQDEEWHFTKKYGLMQLIVDSSRILGLGFGIVILVLLLLNKKIEIGAFGAAITTFQSLQNNFSRFLITLSDANQHVPFIADLIKFLEIGQRGKEEEHNFIGLDNGIVLNNVSFAYYGTDKMVLKNINTNIKKGETIALVGVNGAGKTTLIKVLLGLYQPTEGTIKYDNIDLSQLNSESVYKKVSVVFQDYVKYLLSLRENIAFGDIDNIDNDNKIIKTMEDAEIDELLERLPNKLESQLGREFDGSELSIGQWQKIAIARGVVGNNEIVVLDEPTASLDPMIESTVFKHFASLAKGKTAILVSHRIGSARIADRIIVLDDGSIVEEGTHSELIERKGKYFELYNFQAKWYN